MKVKENLWETIRYGKPDALINEWEAFSFISDPVTAYMSVAERGKTKVNPWGVTVYWGKDEPGSMPLINDKTKVCKDICRWREYVKVPDIRKVPMDWSRAVEDTRRIRGEGRLSIAMMASGLFEQTHALMGFEDVFIAMLEEPEAMHELLDCILDFKLTWCRMLVENCRPDAVLFHDDWGSKKSLFVSRDTWAAFFKERYRKIYGYLRENGVLVIHHADCYCETIAEDMAEIGVDVWQGVTPENNIPKMQKRLRGKMAFMGGLDASVIDVPDHKEDIIRGEVRRACEEYVPGGGFIPCLTYGGDDGSIYPEVDEIVKDEIAKWSRAYFHS